LSYIVLNIAPSTPVGATAEFAWSQLCEKGCFVDETETQDQVQNTIHFLLSRNCRETLAHEEFHGQTNHGGRIIENIAE